MSDEAVGAASLITFDASMARPDYLALGHITRDLTSAGGSVPGGTVLYAATTAQRLGLQAALLTAAANVPADVFDPRWVARVPSVTTSTFENRYVQGVRQQWVHAIAEPLDLSYLPLPWQSAPIVHIGPVLHECTLEMLAAFAGALIGVTPQGWMRQWQSDLPSPVERIPWRPSADWLQRVDLLVLSSEDVGGDEALVVDYARNCRLVAFTRGVHGITLYIRGKPHDIPAHPAVERDPTGAGDVFAAAMLVYLYETGAAVAAAHFAAVVAAAAVEGPGISHIPSRAEVLRRMQ